MPLTDVTPAALGKLPIALTLPNELWIEILLQLDYANLKKACRICKGLQGFIKGKEFDSILFRTGPPDPATPHGKSVSLHPMIEKTEGIFSKFEYAEIYGGQDEHGWKSYYPKDYPAILDEFATRPASTQIDISMSMYAPASQLPPLRNSNGVTVRDLLEHLAKFWSIRPRDYSFEDQDSDPGSVGGLALIAMLRDHNGWAGWVSAIAQGGNRTMLKAYSFDS